MQSVPLAERHTVWLEEEVHFVMGQRETASFLALDTDEARDRFMLSFWNRRDPTPGTPRNEFRDRHHARLEEADRLFTLLETKPGRLTERGRAHQLLGPPQSREDFSYAGDRLFPLELWHYTGRTEAFLPESFYLIYFRDGVHGDYRLWSPVSDGVQALVPHHEPGRFLLDEQGAYQALGRVDIELAQAARSLVPGDGGNTRFFSAESLRINIESYADMADRHRGVDGQVRTRTSFRQLGVASTAAVLYDATGIPQVHYALEVPFSKVQWREEGNRFRASFGITCQMSQTMDVLGRPVDAIEDWIDLDLSEEEWTSSEGQALSLQGRLILPTGRYGLDFTLVSTPAGTSDTASLTVDVPALSGREVSPILLARSRVGLDDGRFHDRLPFQNSEFLWSPSPDGVFPATEAVAVLQITGREGGTSLHWSLSPVNQDDDIIWETKRELAPVSLAVRTVQQVIPLSHVADGAYTLKVRLPDASSGTRITVDRAVTLQKVRVLSRESLTAGDGRIRFQRGLLFARIGDTESAIDEMREASRLLPRDLEIHLKLAFLLYATERYAEVIVSLQPLARHYPNEPDVFVLLGFASLELGDAGKAISYLQSALALRPDDDRLTLALARAREQSGSRPP